MAGFLGLGAGGAPEVYDAASFRADGGDGGDDDGDVPDMLVRNARLGEPLAACFDSGAVVALMRGHGMTVIGAGVEEVVSRCVYTMKNAGIQTAALTMQSAFAAQSSGGGGGGGASAPQGLKFLEGGELEATAQMVTATAQRPWKLWVREVEASGLYLNSA